MTQTIRDVMTGNPVTMQADHTAAEAARRMRDDKIGAVLVLEGDALCGIVTDRDLVVRAIAEAKDPDQTALGSLCTRSLVSVHPEDSVDQVIEQMRQGSIRRIPVLENDKPVGIVSLGDLAVARDRHSLLGAISSAPANN